MDRLAEILVFLHVKAEQILVFIVTPNIELDVDFSANVREPAGIISAAAARALFKTQAAFGIGRGCLRTDHELRIFVFAAPILRRLAFFLVVEVLLIQDVALKDRASRRISRNCLFGNHHCGKIGHPWNGRGFQSSGCGRHSMRLLFSCRRRDVRHGGHGRRHGSGCGFLRVKESIDSGANCGGGWGFLRRAWSHNNVWNIHKRDIGKVFRSHCGFVNFPGRRRRWRNLDFRRGRKRCHGGDWRRH